MADAPISFATIESALATLPDPETATFRTSPFPASLASPDEPCGGRRLPRSCARFAHTGNLTRRVRQTSHPA